MQPTVDIDVSDALRHMEEKRLLLRQTILVKAGTDAGTVISNALAAFTPERDEGDRNEENPHLVDSIVIETEVDAEGRGVVVHVGFGNMGYVANFVEYGHRMVGHKPDKKQLGMVQPKPFMRPAAAVAAEAAIDAFLTAIKGVIDDGE